MGHAGRWPSVTAPRPFRRCDTSGVPTDAAPQPDRSRQLAAERFDLRQCVLGGVRVAELPGPLHVLAQLGEPLLVGGARPRVDEIARVAVATRPTAGRGHPGSGSQNPSASRITRGPGNW